MPAKTSTSKNKSISKSKAETYTQKAKTVSIRFTSRASVKIRDNFYTVEACEERTLPEDGAFDLNKERELLWDSVNAECDNQIQNILRTFKK